MDNRSRSSASSSPPTTSPHADEVRLLDKLKAFKIEGKDKAGRKILRIVGKYFPARSVSGEGLRRYLEEKIFPGLAGAPFSVVYFHTGVARAENFPGISPLRSAYDAAPTALKESLHGVYFIHPGLQARLFFATFGRLLFGAGLCGKLRYINRVEFLWERVRRGQVALPEFVQDHDDALEYRPLMDYGLDTDRDHDHHHHISYDSPAFDSSAASMYSLRCIS